MYFSLMACSLTLTLESFGRLNVLSSVEAAGKYSKFTPKESIYCIPPPWIEELNTVQFLSSQSVENTIRLKKLLLQLNCYVADGIKREKKEGKMVNMWMAKRTLKQVPLTRTEVQAAYEKNGAGTLDKVILTWYETRNQFSLKNNSIGISDRSKWKL